MNVHSLLAAESVQLVSFYKPLLIFVVFLPWAWLWLIGQKAEHHSLDGELIPVSRGDQLRRCPVGASG